MNVQYNKPKLWLIIDLGTLDCCSLETFRLFLEVGGVAGAGLMQWGLRRNRQRLGGVRQFGCCSVARSP